MPRKNLRFFRQILMLCASKRRCRMFWKVCVAVVERRFVLQGYCGDGYRSADVWVWDGQIQVERKKVKRDVLVALPATQCFRGLLRNSYRPVLNTGVCLRWNGMGLWSSDMREVVGAFLWAGSGRVGAVSFGVANARGDDEEIVD